LLLPYHKIIIFVTDLIDFIIFNFILWILFSNLRRIAEINIFPLIEQLLENKMTVVTPKTLPKRQLKHLVLKSLNELEKGVFGTKYPAGDEVFEGEYDLIIVPGLSFDNNNYRLGYGGGYYDNFMVNHTKAKKIGIFYPFQEMEEIPLESHDVRLDEILVNKDFLDF
jgi:5-formyltetrahydrofolate cyclo-ligase